MTDPALSTTDAPPPEGEPPVLDRPWTLYGPEHAQVRAHARAWVTEHITSQVGGWEAAGEFPRELFISAGDAGLLGWKVPPSFGGRGPDLLADAVVSEELAACGSGGVAAALGAHKDLGAYYLWRFGTAEQRRAFVPRCVTGEVVGALAVTEPGAGSDVAGITTRARRDPGGDWILSGTKLFITNGTWADVVVVAAVTDPDAGAHHGTTLFLVEAGDPGFTARRIATLGWRTSHTGELSFADVRLPASRVLGGEAMLGQGFVCIMRNFQWERIGMALGAVRAAEEHLSLAEALASGGDQTLAELRAQTAAARSLTEHAVRLHVHGGDAVREVSMAKWYACDLAARTAEHALLRAGAGHPETPRLERAVRDARLGPIGGGTTEIMLEVIGRGYGL